MSKQPGDYVPGLIPFFGNYFIQVGAGSFTNNESDTSVRTALESLKCGQASYTSSTASATDAGCVLAVESDVSSGTVAIHRQNASNALTDLTDAAFTYMLIGTVDLTD